MQVLGPDGWEKTGSGRFFGVRVSGAPWARVRRYEPIEEPSKSGFPGFGLAPIKEEDTVENLLTGQRYRPLDPLFP